MMEIINHGVHLVDGRVLVDGTAEELNKQLNEEIIEKNKFARKQLIKKAEEEREEMIKDINEKLEINKLKREMMERVDDEIVDKLIEELKKMMKDNEYERKAMKKQHEEEMKELKKERDKLVSDFEKLTKNMFNANNGGNKKDIRDLDFNTQYRINQILNDEKLSGTEKAALIEALRQGYMPYSFYAKIAWSIMKEY